MQNEGKSDEDDSDCKTNVSNHSPFANFDWVDVADAWDVVRS
jgi:hypothetical protein